MWLPHLTVACVVERDARFLLVEERIEGRLVLNQPAGHVDPGESLVQAAVRETLEETAWQVRPTAIVSVSYLRAPEDRTSFLRVSFAADAEAFDPDRALDSDIVRAVWLTEAEIAAESSRHRSPAVAGTIVDYLRGMRFPLSLVREFET